MTSLSQQYQTSNQQQQSQTSTWSDGLSMAGEALHAAHTIISGFGGTVSGLAHLGSLAFSTAPSFDPSVSFPVACEAARSEYVSASMLKESAFPEGLRENLIDGLEAERAMALVNAPSGKVLTFSPEVSLAA